ncbi:hypothetical protein FB567DRAFT_245277 [Paraphoma chrysanthemicola]|uniref:Uncharacterized protein n=1 Tax=Paraphoma chrysanthemicola TaxID=798071 RepID=A0A8K0QTH2_9PLEO|nr:hypothetical protein FB567DRAFT_245277 [Paraphoma chrysanthemicola]
MPQLPLDNIATLSWSAFFLFVLRSISVCAFLCVSVDWDTLLRAAIHVHVEAGHRTQRSTTPACSAKPGRNGSAVKSSTSGRRQPTKGPTADVPSDAQQHPRCSPPPYSVDAPKSASSFNATESSIIALYEDIMASDSQTIKVQQDTMRAQQEIIRSQAQVISKMRMVLEEQDDRIEELEGMRRRGRSL